MVLYVDVKGGLAPPQKGRVRGIRIQGRWWLRSGNVGDIRGCWECLCRGRWEGLCRGVVVGHCWLGGFGG